MKKFLTFVALLAVAGATQAATLNWSINQIKVNGALLNGGTAYLFILQQSGDFGATPTTVNAVKAFIEGGATVVKDDAGKAKALKLGNDTIDIAAEKATTSGAVAGATGYNGSAFVANDSLSAFAVIFDGAYGTAQNYIVTGTADVSWTSSSGGKPLNFGSQADARWNPVAVPEPATATLALAGLALLLKRRRA